MELRIIRRREEEGRWRGVVKLMEDEEEGGREVSEFKGEGGKIRGKG